MDETLYAIARIVLAKHAPKPIPFDRCLFSSRNVATTDVPNIFEEIDFTLFRNRRNFRSLISITISEVE